MRSALLVMALLCAAPASAASVRLDFGADDWFNETAVFTVTVAPMVHLTRQFSVGGRFGMLLTTSPVVAGVPVDLDIRFRFHGSPLYVEGLAGPWFLFQGDTVHGHGAFGFGLQVGAVSFGLEVGYLQPDAIAGARLGFVF